MNVNFIYFICILFVVSEAAYNTNAKNKKDDFMKGMHNHMSHGWKLIGSGKHDYFVPEQNMIENDKDCSHHMHHGMEMGRGHHHHHHKHHHFMEHKMMFGGDEHDYKPHVKKLLGGDDHDYKPHGEKLLGGDDHDYRPHVKKLLGGDDHDYRPHVKKMLGGGDHDYKLHGKKQLIGGDDHDYKPHNKKSHVKAGFLGHMKVFKDFMKTFNRTYISQSEFKKRFNIFRKNMKKAYMLMKSEMGTATYGITKFADMTVKEFRRLLGFRHEMRNSSKSLVPATIPDIEIPAEFDWRERGVVTPVKNQLMCGSCWAFSATGNIEGQWALKYNILYSLSEQELVDCDTSDNGCNGGLPENAYEAVVKLGGLETESAYPYEGKNDKCQFNKVKAKVQVSSSVELPQDEDQLAKWLVKNGPISIGINANALQFYTGGVSHPFRVLCNPENLDHGMLIVGYGIHITKYLHRKKPYWLVKNSWGEDWGEQGYYRVYRGDGTCGLNTMATSAVVP